MGGHFHQTFIDAVREAGDIVRVVSDYVPLKAAGSRLKGLCPFHQEKTPSFSVDPTNQLFYCFGCQTGGDIFKFVTLYEKLSFPEAVELLANRFGVPLPEAQQSNADDPRQRLLRLNADAHRFFVSVLEDPQGGAACRAYLEERGLSRETLERLGVGYAPDSWDALGNHLLAKRHTPSELLHGGLALQRKSGLGQYDRFRDRLIFPIRDLAGRPVAFGGRVIGEGEPKYINSPETPVYTKGDHLYGLDLAQQAIRREGLVIVVEGYLDLAAVLQAGFENVVATLGTAFTPTQARLLSRFSQRVVVSYDGDAAGAAATARSLDMLLERGFEVRVAELPGGMDPDDYIRREGPQAYGKCLMAAPGYLEFLVQREARSRDLRSTEEKIAAVNAVLPHLAKLGNAIERAAWTGRLADALQIEDGLVVQELRGALKDARGKIRQRPRSDETSVLREAEARLVAVLVQSGQERARWAEELDPGDLEGTRVAAIVETILDLHRQGRQVDYPLLLETLQDPRDCELVTRIAFREDADSGPSAEDCLWSFKRKGLRRQEREVLEQIDRLQNAPDQTSDSSDVDRELRRFQQLARQRDALQ